MSGLKYRFTLIGGNNQKNIELQELETIKDKMVAFMDANIIIPTCLVGKYLVLANKYESEGV